MSKRGTSDQSTADKPDKAGDSGGIEPHIKERRAIIRKYSSQTIDQKEDEARPTIGIAFSGGGIRSATISLGLTEALARYNRFYRFDYMSTVSGGGYFGSFLRSLYIPHSNKGSAVPAEPHDIEFEEEIIEKQEIAAFQLANAMFSAPPNAKELPFCNPKGETTNIINPIRWLREHGRYLAPDGSGDLSSAFTYITRNWFGMLFVFAIAIAALQTVLQWFFVGLSSLANHGFSNHVIGWMQVPQYAPWLPTIDYPDMLQSPFMPFLLIGIFLSLSTGFAYWMTGRMAYNPDNSSNPFCKLLKVWAASASLVIIGWIALTYGVPFIANLINAQWATHITDSAKALFQLTLALTLAAIIIGVLTYAYTQSKSKTGGNIAPHNPTPLLRRSLLELQSFFNIAAVTIGVLAMFDIFAVQVVSQVNTVPVDSSGTQNSGRIIDNIYAAIWVAILQPILAYLIKKIPDWTSGSNNSLVHMLRTKIHLVALFLGLFLYGLLALIVTILVYQAMWVTAPDIYYLDILTAILFTGTIITVFLFIGISNGFINLSSLHAFYAARLTRAYMGGANLDRLKDEDDNPVGLYDADHIGSQIYFETVVAAPFHLINVTQNDTFSDDNLIARDRKGRRAVFGYEGLRIEGSLNSWSDLSGDKVEKFSVGQLCAISGAAASSGMGRLTSLGSSLALTYANVRMGYWWDRHDVELTFGHGEEQEMRNPSGFTRLIMAVAGTFVYLFNEMTARYSKDYRRLYLSDGGHSENTGALALLEQGCAHIVVADNAQDQDYGFADMETFIRTARIDLGYSIRVATKQETIDYYHLYDPRRFESFLNMTEDWRAAAREKDSPGFALLLKADKILIKEEGEVRAAVDIIWIKPKLFANLPPDIESYAEMNPPFPQQTTADQFFDEAQWESYRRIGFEMAARIFYPKEALPDIGIQHIRAMDTDQQT